MQAVWGGSGKKLPCNDRHFTGDADQKHPANLIEQCMNQTLPVESRVVRVFNGGSIWCLLRMQELDLAPVSGTSESIEFTDRQVN